MNFVMGMLKKYNAKLLFTDTDSLIYEIETNDIYEDFTEDKNLIDFCDYPQNSKFFGLPNEKVIGKIKEKFGGRKISKFIWLKSKMGSLVDVMVKKGEKAKGFNRSVLRGIRYKKCADVLFDGNWWGM